MIDAKLGRLCLMALLVVLCCLSISVPDISTAQSLRTVDLTDAIHIKQARLVSVDGEGFSRPPSEILASQLPTSGMKTVSLPDLAPREIMAQKKGEVRTKTDWYALDTSPLRASHQPLYLYLPRWKTIGQIAIYGDGRLLFASEGSLVHNGYNHPLLIRLNPAKEQTGPASVLLRIDRLQSSGSAVSTVWVGPLSSLVWRYQIRQILQTQLPYIGSAALLIVGVFSLALWMKLRRDSMYLLFFVTSFVAFVRMLHYHVGANYLPISDEWFEWLTIIALQWLIVLCHCFIERLHERPVRWLTPLLVIVTSICSVVLAPHALELLPHVTLIAPLIYSILLPLAIMIFFDAVRNAYRSQLREVWLMASWLFLAALCCVYDLALQTNVVSPEGFYTNPYAIMGLFVMFGNIMYRRYVDAAEAVEQANAHLAKRLEEREIELLASYDRLREIERNHTLTQERLRLTQDMHDGLGAALVSALRGVETGGMSHVQVSEVLKSCIDDLKLMIDSMELVETDLLLLLGTLRFRLDPRLSVAGIKLHWEVQDLPMLDWLDQQHSLHILRIIQEAFTNVLKHTHATEILVRTTMSGEGVCVSIKDNGQGFVVPLHTDSQSGHGMSNQQRRAHYIGGKVSWTSDSNGTCFTLWLPLKQTSAAATLKRLDS